MRNYLQGVLIKSAFTMLMLMPLFLHAETRELKLLSPHWEGIRWEMAEGFQEWLRERGEAAVEIRWLDVGGTSDILRFLRGAYAAHEKGPEIDLLFGGGIDPFMELSRMGVLDPLPPSFIKEQKLPKSIAGAPTISDRGDWIAPILNGFGILYNRKVLELLHLPPPTKWEDLAKPEYEGLITTPDPRKSGSSHVAIEIILQSLGWERGWDVLYGIGANVKTFASSSIQVPRDVASGESVIGITLDSYAADVMSQYGEERLAFVIPEDGKVVSPDAIALLKGAPEPGLALSFIQFVVSTQGQQILMVNQGAEGGPKKFRIARAGVRKEIYEQRKDLLVLFNPFHFESSGYQFALGAQRWNLLNDLFGEFVVDKGELLRSARRDQRLRLPVPLPEATASELGSRWGDARVRSIELDAMKDKFPLARRSSISFVKYIPLFALLFVGLFVVIRRKRA